MESIDDRNPFGCVEGADGIDEFVSYVLFDEKSDDRYVDCCSECTGSSSDEDEWSLWSLACGPMFVPLCGPLSLSWSSGCLK